MFAVIKKIVQIYLLLCTSQSNVQLKVKFECQGQHAKSIEKYSKTEQGLDALYFTVMCAKLKKKKQGKMHLLCIESNFLEFRICTLISLLPINYQISSQTFGKQYSVIFLKMFDKSTEEKGPCCWFGLLCSWLPLQWGKLI